MKRLLVPAFAPLGLALTACGDVSPNDLRDPTCSATTFNVEGREVAGPFRRLARPIDGHRRLGVVTVSARHPAGALHLVALEEHPQGRQAGPGDQPG